jgi:putative FmdB family regulatory protein
MPTYEYKCESCGIRFDRIQHFSDEALKECPECGGEVHRVFTPVGIIFKGSGFYCTDHRQLSSATSPPRKELSAPKDGEKKALASGKESTSSSGDEASSD